MIPILNSDSQEPSNLLKESKRTAGQNNTKWLQEHICNREGYLNLALFGGKSLVDYRLRIAQSHLRTDMTPSSWSNILILSKIEKDFEKTNILELPLELSRVFSAPISNNGVNEESTIKSFSNPYKYPNVAVLSFRCDVDRIEDAIKNYKKNRPSYDSYELILKWLGFIIGVGKSSNPLFEGYGVPSAVFVETILNSIGFELTPGLPNTTSSPEAIWQSARWWNDFHKTREEVGISGYYSRSHEIQYSEK